MKNEIQLHFSKEEKKIYDKEKGENILQLIFTYSYVQIFFDI